MFLFHGGPSNRAGFREEIERFKLVEKAQISRQKYDFSPLMTFFRCSLSYAMRRCKDSFGIFLLVHDFILYRVDFNVYRIDFHLYPNDFYRNDFVSKTTVNPFHQFVYRNNRNTFCEERDIEEPVTNSTRFWLFVHTPTVRPVVLPFRNCQRCLMGFAVVTGGVSKFFSVVFHRETDLEGHLVHYHLDVVQGRYSIIPGIELHWMYILFE